MSRAPSSPRRGGTWCAHARRGCASGAGPRRPRRMLSHRRLLLRPGGCCWAGQYDRLRSSGDPAETSQRLPSAAGATPDKAPSRRLVRRSICSATVWAGRLRASRHPARAPVRYRPSSYRSTGGRRCLAVVQFAANFWSIPRRSASWLNNWPGGAGGAHTELSAEVLAVTAAH